MIANLLLLAVAANAASTESGGPPSEVLDLPQLRGRWAFVQVTVAVSSAPLIGEVTSETRAEGLLDMKQLGRALQMTEHVCDLQTSSPTPLVSTVYPKAFLSALSGNERRARLEPGPVGALNFVQPKAWDAKGLMLDDPVSDTLPEDPSDPRVRDTDEDGHPGMTVRVNGIVSGDVRVVTRGWTELKGTVESDDRIVGRVRWATEQRILAVTNRLLSHEPKLVPHPDPARSWFTMVRVAEDATCADTRATTDRIARAD